MVFGWPSGSTRNATHLSAVPQTEVQRTCPYYEAGRKAVPTRNHDLLKISSFSSVPLGTQLRQVPFQRSHEAVRVTHKSCRWLKLPDLSNQLLEQRKDLVVGVSGVLFQIVAEVGRWGSPARGFTVDRVDLSHVLLPRQSWRLFAVHIAGTHRGDDYRQHGEDDATGHERSLVALRLYVNDRFGNARLRTTTPGGTQGAPLVHTRHPTRLTRALKPNPDGQTGADGRTWDRTRDLSRVKRALSR
jgi:hypothetical protein